MINSKSSITRKALSDALKAALTEVLKAALTEVEEVIKLNRECEDFARAASSATDLINDAVQIYQEIEQNNSAQPRSGT